MYRPIHFSRQKIAGFLALVCAVFLLTQAALPAFAERPIEEFLILSSTPESVGSSASGLSDEAALALFGRAETGTRWFSTEGCFFLETSSSTKTLDLPDGVSRSFKRTFSSTDKRFSPEREVAYSIPAERSTEADWMKYLQTMFSEDVSRALLRTEHFGIPLFLCENGYVYESDYKGSLASGVMKTELTRISDEAEKVVFRAALFTESNSEWSRYSRRTGFDYVLEKQNGSWIFTAFEKGKTLLRNTVDWERESSFRFSGVEASASGLTDEEIKRWIIGGADAFFPWNHVLFPNPQDPSELTLSPGQCDFSVVRESDAADSVTLRIGVAVFRGAQEGMTGEGICRLQKTASGWEATDTAPVSTWFSAPQTGDSTVFLLPAAALSLCGVFLAAKKRKRAD
jgi:LPXTG-motif cell wall-anchored protein